MLLSGVLTALFWPLALALLALARIGADNSHHHLRFFRIHLRSHVRRLSWSERLALAPLTADAAKIAVLLPSHWLAALGRLLTRDSIHAFTIGYCGGFWVCLFALCVRRTDGRLGSYLIVICDLDLVGESLAETLSGDLLRHEMVHTMQCKQFRYVFFKML